MRHNPTLPIVRRGFTLVELLVAAALCVLVMYVLAEAFRAGTDTLSQLKSVAGLADDLRVAETIIRRDLKEQHLEDREGNAVLVSDERFANPGFIWQKPNRGYFRVVHGSARTNTPTDPYHNEGVDSNNIASAMATDHRLQFTCKLSGKTSTDVFLTSAPSGSGQQVADGASNMVDYASTSTYASRWGEVTYFMAKSSAVMPPEVTTPKALHVLYRRARVLAPPGSGTITVGSANVTNAITGNNGHHDLSGFIERPTGGNSSTDIWIMNTPDVIADPQFRFGPPGTILPAVRTPTPPGGNTFTALAPTTSIKFTDAPIPLKTSDGDYGADILLANVVSMRVQVLNSTTLQYEDPVTTPTPTPPSAVWDTYLTNDSPSRIRGVRIQLRVYDAKNMVTRQVTIDQPL